MITASLHQHRCISRSHSCIYISKLINPITSNLRLMARLKMRLS
nr:MAG TPA: hypothetical protein [Crassvirales sp.]